MSPIPTILCQVEPTPEGRSRNVCVLVQHELTTPGGQGSSKLLIDPPLPSNVIDVNVHVA
jgi:hypothetical protein